MLNRQRYFDKSREYIQEKVKEAIVPSLSTLRTTQYGTAEEKFLAKEIFNYAVTEIKNLDDTVLLHLTGNDDAIIEWYKSHLHGWIDEAGYIERANNVANKADQSEHSTTVKDEKKETNDDADICQLVGDGENDNDKDDENQLPHAQDILNDEDDNNFSTFGKDKTFKHIVDGNSFNNFFFTPSNIIHDDDESHNDTQLPHVQKDDDNLPHVQNTFNDDDDKKVGDKINGADKKTKRDGKTNHRESDEMQRLWSENMTLRADLKEF